MEKIVVVTRKTRLVELVERWNTRAQAKFWIERAGGDFVDYEREDDAYRRALEVLGRSLELGLKTQTIDRALLPTFLFSPHDLVVTMGQDGLVANAAKYVGSQPILAVNPDPARFDGVLLPFTPVTAREGARRVLDGTCLVDEVTLAEATLADGQKLLAFNDLFVGAASHVSARYRIRWGERAEAQSSSGVLISTGAGSTGWLSSVFNMTAGIASFTGGQPGTPLRLSWSDPRLVFVVREPFLSRHSQATIVAGTLAPGAHLEMESLMPSGGIIFSDGMESDFLSFESGATLEVRAARSRARLVAG
ncbi:MAG: NAD+ kinase [Acidobacteriota bacterium]